MNLTVRQWTIVSALAAAFIVAAILVSGDNGGTVVDEAADFDEVAWCETAGAISTWGGILDGIGDDEDDADSITNLRAALADGRSKAPFALRTEIARIADLVMLVGQELDNTDSIAEAIAAGAAQTDEARVASAIEDLDQAITSCGHAGVIG